MNTITQCCQQSTLKQNSVCFNTLLFHICVLTNRSSDFILDLKPINCDYNRQFNLLLSK